MAIAIRGTTPLVVATAANPISGTLTGARQPQSGDLLVIIHGNDYYALSNMPTPTVGGSTAGVSAVSGGGADGGSLFAHAVAYTYAVGSTGDLTVSVTETGAGDEEKVLVVYVLSGADTATPTDGTPGTNFDSGGGSTSRVCNATSPSSSDAFLICHTNDGNGSNSVSYTPPSGMTEQYDGSLSASMGYSGATLQLAASGSTGTKTFAAAGNASYCTLTLAIKTSAAGGAALDPGVPNFGGPAPGLGTPGGMPQPWMGTGSDLTASILAPATEAVGAFSADNPTAAVASNAAEAVSAFAAFDAGVSAGANAEATAAALQAPDGQAAISTNASSADAAIAAPDPATSAGVNAAEVAAAFAAFDATVSTSGSTNAPADVAAFTQTAADALGSTGANAGLPAAAVAAFDATVSVGVNAGLATAAYAADPAGESAAALAALASLAMAASDTSSAVTVSAGPASAAFGADDATGQGSTPGSTAAEFATLVLGAFDAHVRKGSLRPDSGDTGRPGSGTTARPNSGVTLRP